jgi:hypothetical protein
VTLSFKGFSEIAEMETPTPTSANLLFDVPPGTEDGDILVVVATVTGTTDDVPGWCYLFYEDGTVVSHEDGYGPYVSNGYAGHTQGLFATDGVHQSGHGQLRVSFAPGGLAIDPDSAYAVLLAFGGSDRMSEFHDFERDDYDWQTDEYLNTACRQNTDRALHWVHALMSEGPPQDDVHVDGDHTLLPVRGHYLISWDYSFNIALGGPVTPGWGDYAHWYHTDGTAPFNNYKVIVFGLPPTLEELPATATDAAGAVGSGRLPIRTVVS